MVSINRPAIILTVLLCALALGGASVGWWWYERVEMLPGDIPLLPRGELVSSKTNDSKKVAIFTHSCRVPRSAAAVAAWYRDRLGADGWSMSTPAADILDFSSPQRRLRLVLHPADKQTVFTLNLRIQKRR